MAKTIAGPERAGWNPASIMLAIVIAAGWLWITYVTAMAIQQLGIGAAISLFADGMANPWRAQFNTDLVLHFSLVAAWIIYRTRSRILAIVLAMLALNGALFSFAYILILLILAGGDLRTVVLGWRANLPRAQAS